MRVASWLPTGRSGAWEVRRKPGSPDVTELVEHVEVGEPLVWMDDQQSEYDAHQVIIAAAHGRMWMSGLGLGFLPAILAKDERVESITIVERSTDVMRLVEPHFMSEFGNRKEFRIITADAETWQPNGERYDVAWVDHAYRPLEGSEADHWIAHASQWANQVLLWRGG